MFFPNAKMFSKGGSTNSPSEFAYLPDLFRRKSTLRMPLTFGHGAVNALVCRIFGRGSPTQVLGVHAPSVPAGMCSLMRRARLAAMGFLANNNMRPETFPFNLKRPISPRWKGEWPFQAFFADVGNRHLDETLLRFGGCHFQDRSAMTLPSLIVGSAKSLTAMALATAFNAAYSSISHSAVLSRGGQGRALLTQRFRPDFHNRFTLRSQGLAPC